MKESLRHIRDTNRVIASSELFLGNKDCPALAIHLAYHIECLPYKSRFSDIPTNRKMPLMSCAHLVQKELRPESGMQNRTHSPEAKDYHPPCADKVPLEKSHPSLEGLTKL